MATAGTQFTGLAAETFTAAQTAGFLGWSAEPDRTVYTVTGGTPKGAYANSTAYAVGDVVSNGGSTFRALSAVLNTNTTAPVVGAVWADASKHRGPVEVPGPRIQHYR